MRRTILAVCLSALLMVSFAALAGAETPSDASVDFDIPGGHFYTQTNGGGASQAGYTVTNADGIPFWDAYQQAGGPMALGYPVTSRFTYDGFVTQAMQKAVLQWRPDTGQVAFLNTFDALHDKGKDDWLQVYRQTPKPLDTAQDNGLSWDAVVKRHLALLDQNLPIKNRFLSDSAWMDHYGLPVSYADAGNSFVIRAQRATFQFWKADVPWAVAGDVTVANGGDLAKEAGLWPSGALALVTSDGRLAGMPTNLALAVPSAPTATSAPQPTPAPPTPVPFGPKKPGIYYTNGPDYGMFTFTMGYPQTSFRDLMKVHDAGFGWTKTLLQWGQIERTEKGKYYWDDADRVVREAASAGVRLIVRIDFTPDWARMDHTQAGPPDILQNYADFINAFVSRYKKGSQFGHVDAIEIWNEPNLSFDWNGQIPDPAKYTQMLCAANQGAKAADPSVVVLTAGLSPTGTNNAQAMPDDVYLQKMYEAGAKGCFDALGAHAPGYKAPPEMSPEQVAADPNYGGHRSFTFRRVEDLHDIMVRNGDTGKQVWLTEFGWTSDSVHPAYAWHAVTEQQKSDYLVRAFQWARNNWSPWIGVMCVWGLPRADMGPQHEEWWWGITNGDGTNRPAYDALKAARQNGTLP